MKEIASPCLEQVCADTPLDVSGSCWICHTW